MDSSRFVCLCLSICSASIMLRTERIFSGSAGSYWDVAERVGSTTTTRYIMGVFRGGQGNHATPPLNRRLSGFYMEKRLCWDCSLYQKFLVDLKYAKNALAAGLRPGSRWGSSRRSPRLTSRLGRGTPPPQSLPLSAPFASILAPSEFSFCAP